MSPAATARPAAAPHGGEIDILRSFARRIDPSDAGAYNNLGVLYFRKGLTDEAIVAFARALALDERMGVARRNLEIAYGDSGILERRLHELEERLRANPQDLEALVQSGIAEKTAGRLERAHTLFKRAIELDTNSSVLHFLLAETLYNRGLHEEAMRSVRRSIELNPDNPDALYLIGFILGDLGRSDEAAEANRRAVMLNPTLVRAQTNLSLQAYRHDVTPSHQQKTPAGAHITLGRALRQKGYFQEALREYEKAIEGGEANAEVLQAMLELYLLQRDTGAAIATADRFAREFSPTAKTWNGRGVALQLEGRHSEAEESYTRALEIDSSYPFAHNNVGVLLWYKSDTKGAINSFRRALQAPTPPVEARLNLALGLFRRKHTELALEAYRQVLSDAPEHPVAWNGIGLILVELSKYPEARNAFARAIQSNPDFAEAHYNLSFTLSNLGDFSSALRETKRALSLDPMYTPQKLELSIELPHEEIRLTVAPPITDKDEAVERVEDFHFDPAIIEELFAEKPVRPEGRGEDAMAGFSLARDFITKGMYDRAQAEIARVLARGGDKVIGLVLAGDGFAAQGLHGEALERYHRALDMEPANTYARQGTARSLLALGRAEEARPFAEALVEAGSTDVNLLLLAAEARVASLDNPGAREILVALRKSESQNANVMKRVGDLYASLSDAREAIAAYRASLSVDERQVDTRVALGRLLAKAGDDTGAIRELETVLVTSPNHDAAVVELVGPYRRTGRSRSALPRVVALIRRDVYHFAALIALGEILIDLAREVDAMNAFERVLRFDPNDAEALRYHRLLQKRAALMAIEGPLRELGIHDVFQLLDLSRKTGTLRITSPERNNEGSVYFDAGTIVAATMKSNPHLLGTILERSGKATAADLARATAMQRAGDKRRVGEILVAHGIVTPRDIDRFMRQQIETVVFDLMSWSEGFFSFTEEPARPMRKDIAVRVSTESLLMEGARRIDEWSRMADKIPDARVTPRLAPLDDGPESFIDLLPREWEVLSVIDGERNLHAIAQRLVLPEFEVAKIIYGMLSTGLIEIMPHEGGIAHV